VASADVSAVVDEVEKRMRAHEGFATFIPPRVEPAFLKVRDGIWPRDLA